MISHQATTYSTEDFQLPVPVRWPMLQWQSIHSAERFQQLSRQIIKRGDYRQREHVIFKERVQTEAVRRWGQVEPKFLGRTQKQIQLEHNERRIIMRTFKKIELEP